MKIVYKSVKVPSGVEMSLLEYTRENDALYDMGDYSYQTGFDDNIEVFVSGKKVDAKKVRIKLTPPEDMKFEESWSKNG